MQIGLVRLAMIVLAARMGAALSPLRGRTARALHIGQLHAAPLCEEERVVYGQLLNDCLVKETSSLLLCVSGGLDSMALLHLVAAVKKERLPSLSLQVINFNHKLRPEADEEAEFVSGWASKYGIPFLLRVMPEDMRSKVTNESGSNFQNVARNWRRSECLALLKDKRSSSAVGVLNDGSGIVTAHHSDDQVETTMLKLLRGSHLSRLYPILPRSECGHFIRPLLPFSKDQLQQYLQERGLEWREDSSNQLRKYKRNEVRLDVIPALEAASPGGASSLRRRILALGQQSAQLHEWLREEAAKFFASDPVQPKIAFDEPLAVSPSTPHRYTLSVDPQTSAFARLPTMVQSEVLHSICDYLTGASTDFTQTQKLLRLSLEDLAASGVKSKALRVSDEWQAVKVGGAVLRFERASPGEAVNTNTLQFFLPTGTTLQHPVDLSVEAKASRAGQGGQVPLSRCVQTPPGRPREYHLQLYGVSPQSNLVVRRPKPGDSFQPSWRNSPLKLVDFLRGKGVPVHLRDEAALVVVDGVVTAVLHGESISLAAAALTSTDSDGALLSLVISL